MLRIFPLALFLLGLVIAAPRAQLLTTGAGKGVGPTYTPQGVTFNSGASFLRAGTALTGASNSFTSGLVSVWISNTNTIAGAVHAPFGLALSGSANAVGLSTSTSTGHLVLGVFNSGGTQVVSYASVTVFAAMASTAWHHALWSFNVATATPRCQLVVDGGPGIEGSAATCTGSQTVGYLAATNPQIGAYLVPAAGFYNASMADLQFWWNVDVDLTSATNRGYFISGPGGNAVNPTVAAAALGTPQVIATGAPTGTNGGNWGNNSGGTGGALILQTGSITTAPSNPP